jgi:hypothetical protein
VIAAAERVVRANGIVTPPPAPGRPPGRTA